MTKYTKLLECPFCHRFLDFQYEILKASETKEGSGVLISDGSIIKIWHDRNCPNCGRSIRAMAEFLKDD